MAFKVMHADRLPADEGRDGLRIKSFQVSPLKRRSRVVNETFSVT